MKIPLHLTTFSAALLLGMASASAQTASQPAPAPAPAPAPGAEAKVQKPVRVTAKKEDLSKLDAAGLVKKLQQVLDQIEGLIRSRIDPTKVEDRLRSRSPSYRQVAIMDAPPEQDPKVVPLEGKEVDIQPEAAGPKVRLFGDAEKGDLPKGTVLVVEGMPVSEAEVKSLEDFYNGYSSRNHGTAREKALEALIVVKSIQARYKDKLPKLEKEMAEIRKSIVDGGKDFADVAKKRSHGPSSNQGGDLGFFPRDGMVAAFSKAAFALKVGSVSEAFASPFGIHILKVTGRKKGSTPSEDQVKASHILLLYDKDDGALRGLMQQATMGQSKIAVLNEEWRASLPAAYR